MSAIITSSIEEAAKVITQGGVIICPSEGVYGLSCSLLDENAIKRVIKIKRRDIRKGLILVDHNLNTLEPYLDSNLIDKASFALMNKMWPGPHTFVVPTKDNFKSTALRDNHTVAIRITGFKPLATLCNLAKVPLISTSANISGQEATSDIDKLNPILLEEVDLVLNLPCGGLSSPTSIYDTLSHTLVREGPEWNEHD